jgi:regulatory protein
MIETQGKTLAERYCSGAEHCCQEVRAMLERHGIESAEIDMVIGHLVKEGYIDELRYANAFVHDKVRFAKWGRIKIGQALRQKRIPDVIAQHALQSIDHEEYMGALKDVVRSRLRMVKGANDYERKMKTMKTVCGRGYEPSLVRTVLDMPDSADISC